MILKTFMEGSSKETEDHSVEYERICEGIGDGYVPSDAYNHLPWC